MTTAAVDAYDREVRSRGTEILTPPTDRAYGLCAFIIGAPDGDRIMVAQCNVTRD